ncbi:uncharacterized protein [Apostichopus japonicus]|uniref:uncharacterized protein n=1 Tax=Stichopus japonicus TaxID=307972 RepID=UPI003AB71ED4
MDVCNEAGSGLEQVVERSLTPPKMRRSFKLVLYREIWKCYLKVEVEELDTLAQDINGLKYSAQVASILDSNEPSISKGMAQLGLKDNQPLVDLKLSPCKPLFSDIVLNHIEFSLLG